MKKLLGGVFALAWIVGLTACLVEEPEEGEDGDDEVEAEEVGEAQQEIGEGGTCIPGFANCDSGLNCCIPQGQFSGKCRDLDSDEANCGECFNECPVVWLPPFPPAQLACVDGECDGGA